MIRQNDNHSPGPGPGKLVNLATSSSAPSAEEIRESESVFQYLMVWGENVSISNGELKCKGMMIHAAPNQWGEGDVICWYTGFTLQTFV